MQSERFNVSILPKFNEIDPAKIEPTIRALLEKNRKKLADILAQKGPYTWANLMQPIEVMSDELHKHWSPVAHLHSVMESEPLREAYNSTLPILTEYHTEYSQNAALFTAIKSLTESAEFSSYTPAQKKLLENEIRDFKLSGVHLSADKKAQLSDLHQRVSQLTTQFAENLLDATNGWILHLKDARELAGVPETVLQLASDNAKQRNLEGYVITLDLPSYSTAMKFLNNRELRKTLYNAYATRASDQGPNANKFDNTKIMADLLETRHNIANLVGFKNFAEYSLATKMAKNPEEVLAFLYDLVDRSKPYAEKEFHELIDLAKSDGLSHLEVWDIAYYSEKLREQKYNFSAEDLRPYFPFEKVMHGMFKIVNTIYGLSFNEEKDVQTWHPDVKFYSVYDESNHLRGGFYVDLYARQHKRDGAWMDDCINRRRTSQNDIQLPVAYLTCNFMPPVEDKPALLTHDDVLTLFHEFGHCLHHLLTRVDFPSVGGINGVPWDAVEFPSQFMENFCWEKDSLHYISAHYQTGESIPQDLYEKMLKAKYFQTGLQMVRQLEFALFDFRIHYEYQPNAIPNFVQETLDDVRRKVCVIKVPSFNRFQHSFSHVFAGGYAAGYYSYKWAEVLSEDAYAKFEENGILDPKTGKSFMQNILEVGGVRDPMDSFIAFRGRKPTIDALLRHSGIK